MATRAALPAAGDQQRDAGGQRGDRAGTEHTVARHVGLRRRQHGAHDHEQKAEREHVFLPIYELTPGPRARKCHHARPQCRSLKKSPSSPSTSTAPSSTGRPARTTPSPRRPRRTATRSPRRSSSRSSSRSSRRSRAGPTSSTPRSCAAPRSRSRASSAGRSSPRAPGSCPNSVARWPPFKETNTQLDRFAQEVRARTHLQHRRQAARRDAPLVQDRLRSRGHRAAGPLLQAGPGPLQGGRAPDRHQEGLGARRPRATTTTSSRASRPRSP